MQKIAKKYRAIMDEADYLFNLDNGMGYKFLVANVSLFVGALIYSVGLELGLII